MYSAFICASPLSHADVIHECLKRNWDTFTELNLVDTGYDEKNGHTDRSKNVSKYLERGV